MVLASSACADSAWNRSASWLSTSAARSAAPRSIIRHLSSAARARSVRRRGTGRQPAAGEEISDRCPDDDPEQQSGKQQDRTHMQR